MNIVATTIGVFMRARGSQDPCPPEIPENRRSAMIATADMSAVAADRVLLQQQSLLVWQESDGFNGFTAPISWCRICFESSTLHRRKIVLAPDSSPY
jgi:hypothetical protein